MARRGACRFGLVCGARQWPVVFASPHASTPDATFRVIHPPANTPIRIRVDPPSVAGGAVWVHRDGTRVLTPANDSGVEIHRAGSILLIAGVVGMILSMLFLLWSSRARQLA